MTTRDATQADAEQIAEIYSAGILERVATFETSPRSTEDVLKWFESPLPKVVVEEAGVVLGYAACFPYSDRCCYGGVAEYSVYVAPEHRGRGIGKLATEALIARARDHGLHKLLSRIFPENRASLALMKSLGFKEVGLHEKHGKLDGQWRDVVAVELVIEENL